jgi:hypothetical protein
MPVDDTEILARFIQTEGWLNNGQVKGDAFLPGRDHKGKLKKISVTRHSGLDDQEVNRRLLIFEQIPRPNPIHCYGWADVMAYDVRHIQVQVSGLQPLDIEEASSQRDAHHANIIDWDEAYYMLQAEEVARQSSYRSRLSN